MHIPVFWPTLQYRYFPTLNIYLHTNLARIWSQGPDSAHKELTDNQPSVGAAGSFERETWTLTKEGREDTGCIALRLLM